MENSFLNGIISSALAAQDQQETLNSDSNMSESQFSGITEKDGYVGEMVKASLAIFEAKKPADYDKAFDKNYIVVINSLSATVADTDLEVEFDADPIDSIKDLLNYIEDRSGLELDSAMVTFGSDNKIHISQDSEYGPVNIEVGVDAYQSVEPNKVLMLPNS